MKRRIIFIVVLISLATALYSRPYAGISQGFVGSGVEVGYLTRSFEQNLSINFPFVQGQVVPMGGAVNLLYRIQRFNPLIIGIGPTARLAWQADTGLVIRAGVVLSVGWEVLGKREILFVEGAYVPVQTELWGPLDLVGEELVSQYVRIGWRHLF